MNRESSGVAFVAFVILCVSFGLKTSDAQSDRKIDEIIVTKIGGNVTLPCNPSLRENSTLSSLASGFEWVDEFDLPLFSNGKLSLIWFEGGFDNSSIVIGTNPPGTLIIRKIYFTNTTFTCTFTTSETKVTYSYFLQVNDREASPYFAFEPISFENRGKRVALDCSPENSVSHRAGDFSYFWLIRKFRLNNATGEDDEDIEVISLNQTILVKNNTERFQVADNKSLIIPNLSPAWKTEYECHTSTRCIFAYSANWNEYNESESRDWTVTNSKKQSFFVKYATRNVVLPCPSINQNSNSSYKWFLESKIMIDFDLLFINSKKIAFNAFSSFDFYEINNDGSLIILFVGESQYGKYICQRSTGEQYIYNINKEYKMINETISINSNTSTITLPCPIQDPRYRNYSPIIWQMYMRNISVSRFLPFINGKILKILSQPDELPDNVKLADDKTSLIVSNLTSSSINDEYICTQYFSNIVYIYIITK